MIYPSEFEKKIGFDAIRSLISDYCLSPLGKRNVEEMQFSADYKEVSRRLRLTAEMLALLNSGAAMPVDGIFDLTHPLRALRIEGNFLTPQELYRLGRSLRLLESIQSFFKTTDEDNHLQWPLLAEEFSQIAVFRHITSRIDSIINKYGEIADNASPQLYDLRRSISAASAALNSSMRRVLDRAVSAGIIEADTSPSMRDGRLVIPVNAANKRAIPGIVHDESATGKTSYIEPVEVVAASNRLRELQEEEKREIRRILIEIAAEIRPEAPAILENMEHLGVYDFIRAKGLLAKDFNGELPVLEKWPEIDWFGAVHPLLAISLKKQGKQVVPLDIRLDRTNRILIISGPNAGGKSVTIKTVGLIQYMAQCGLLPTLHANSHLGIFSDIFLEIGDSQSIENDLSTYSSHLKNMKFFLRNASSTTLILIDEMGSGTEPQIGSALAQSIIAALNDARVYGIITTHYQNLKTFAAETPGLINGAMLYDRGKMQPLFKLSIGTAGSSFALEIAHKIGLPQAVIAGAKEIVGSDYVDMDKHLLEINRDRRYWQNKRQNIREKEAKLDALLEKYELQAADLKQRRNEIIGEARRQAKEILEGTNRKVERTILEIRNAQAEKERTKELRKELEEYKKQVNEDNKEAEPIPGIKPVKRKKKSQNTPAPSKPVPEKKQIEVGDYVKMSQGGSIGKVLAINGKNAEVAFGALRTHTALTKLQPASAPKPTAATQHQGIAKSTYDDSRKRQLNFKTEIDLRGMRADEALQAVTYFIDDAVQFGMRKLRILHGTGTGALRHSIRQYLQSVNDVESFGDEDVRFGGAGITIVNLR